MHHHLTRALVGPLLFLASNTGLAHDPAPAIMAPDPVATAQDPVPLKGRDPGFTARELASKAARGGIIKLSSIPMPDGSRVDVELEAWRPFAAGRTLEFSRATDRGRSVQRVLDMQTVTFLKGHVRGRKDSVVMIAAKDDRMEGFLSYPGTSARITREAGKAGPRDVIRPARERELPVPESMGCGMDIDDLSPELGAAMSAGGLAGTTDDCAVIRLAFEIDHDLWTSQLNEDGLVTLVYIAKLLYTTDEVVRRTLGAQIELASANVWYEADDPWTQGSTVTQLNQFMDYCNDPANGMLETPRDATLLLSSRSLGGGRAGGIGALSCDRPELAYAVCGSLSGDFPYPAEDHVLGNWDIFVFIHELGHLLDAIHTHTFDPPVDTCGLDSAEVQHGSVMSYCHLCPGHTRNISLGFHMRNRDRARGYFDAIGCLEGRQASIRAYDDEVAAYRNTSTAIDVLFNDSAVCSGATVHDHDAFSAEGGIVRLQAGAGPLGRDLLNYRPRLGFIGTDTFSYQAIDEHGNLSMAQVVVEVEPAPFITDPEYLVLDTITNSISRFDAETHEFKGDLVPDLAEFLVEPRSILPLPDTNLLIGDRELQKILAVDIHGEYQGVFYEHPDLIWPEAMVEADGRIFILDSLGGWVFATGMSGGDEGVLFSGTSGFGWDMAMGDDGTLWITGSVNGNDLIGIDPVTGAIRHEIRDLVDIDTPGAIACVDGRLMIADAMTGVIGLYYPWGSGYPDALVVSGYRSAADRIGGGLEFVRAPGEHAIDDWLGLVTGEGLFECTELGTVKEISRNGRGPLEGAGAIALRSLPETSPDLNADGCVDGADLSKLLAYFNAPISSFPRADLDRNGVIDGGDLSILLGAWSDCP